MLKDKQTNRQIDNQTNQRYQKRNLLVRDNDENGKSGPVLFITDKRSCIEFTCDISSLH